tara:strand:+ start:109 stop:786 length:678 start_codon:yes stop_codon:yes gene_type:complete
MIIPNEQWSFSSLKTFDQCPKKYYHIKIAQDVVSTTGTAALWGKQFHTAAELYVCDSKKLPKEFQFAKDFLDVLIALKGIKFCELKMGAKLVNGKVDFCSFDDPDYWWHGIADFVNVNGTTAISIDYKTGKDRYADTTQLDAVAIGMFLNTPQLDKIKSALAFVTTGKLVRKTHYRENLDLYISKFIPMLEKLAATKKAGVWNPIAGPLCGWCPVTHCEHWEDRT